MGVEIGFGLKGAHIRVAAPLVRYAVMFAETVVQVERIVAFGLQVIDFQRP